MYKYEMVIDGEDYSAIFTKHEDAWEFIEQNEQEDDAIVTDIYYDEVTPSQVYRDPEFSDADAAEAILSYISPAAYKACKLSSEVVAIVKELAEFFQW